MSGIKGSIDCGQQVLLKTKRFKGREVRLWTTAAVYRNAAAVYIKYLTYDMGWGILHKAVIIIDKLSADIPIKSF